MASAIAGLAEGVGSQVQAQTRRFQSAISDSHLIVLIATFW
ncbi:MAG: hypothetical protein V3V12_01090 [Gammaproteobacteria bacterium]